VRLLAFKFTIILAMVIMVLSAVPGNLMPDLSFKAGDKWGHFLAYGTLTLAFSTEYANQLRWSSKSGRWLIIVGAVCIAYGMLIEVLQGLIFYHRTFDFADMLANALGVGLGMVLFQMFFNTLQKFKRIL
jgi:VanZ family protein